MFVFTHVPIKDNLRSLVCVRVKVSDGDWAVGMVCIVTRCGQECDVLECFGCSVCPTPLFLPSCPLSPPHASFYPPPSRCPSDLLFRPSVCLWLLAFVFFCHKQHAVSISLNLLAIFFKYLVSDMFQGCRCCDVFCRDKSILLILCSRLQNNDNSRSDLDACGGKATPDLPAPKLSMCSIKISKTQQPTICKKKKKVCFSFLPFFFWFACFLTAGKLLSC